MSRGLVSSLTYKDQTRSPGKRLLQLLGLVVALLLQLVPLALPCGLSRRSPRRSQAGRSRERCCTQQGVGRSADLSVPSEYPPYSRTRWQRGVAVLRGSMTNSPRGYLVSQPRQMGVRDLSHPLARPAFQWQLEVGLGFVQKSITRALLF